MANGILGTGISGLQSAQRALTTTSHNIANVNTEGYSRQRVLLETRPPERLGDGFVGTGVTVSSIQRHYDEFNTMQLRSATSAHAQAQQYHALGSQINNLLAVSGAGIMPALQDFFDSVQGVANDPTSTVARQVMISEANHLASQIGHFDSQLEAMRKNTNSALTAAVDQVNAISSAIADLNRKISESRTVGAAPNDLLDQRDELIRHLSEQVSVTTMTQDDGSINVFIGNGQAVVAGFESRRITAAPNAYDPDRLEIAYAVSPSPVVITSQLSGGKIGGILEFRNQVLEPTQRSLGQLAVGIAETFNAQHASGMDLAGALGGDFFRPIGDMTTPPTTQVLANANNTSQVSATPTVVISDAGALTPSEYLLERNGSAFLLTRLSDNRVFQLPGFPGAEATVDGMTITPGAGTVANGDSFLIRPARNAALNFGVAIADPARIAAADPVRTSVENGNTGSGTVAGGQVFDGSAYTGQSYRIVALDSSGNGETDSYSVLDGDGNAIATGAFAAGSAVEFDGIRVTLGGTPAPGDEFIVTPNINGVSDNRNALALAALQTRNTLSDGTASYEAIYGRMVADAGNKVHQAGLNLDVQSGMLNRAVAAREEISGVNLDEEAAAILKYQQAYQASAQLIAAANTLFDTLISMLRR